jgi:hypothetical protein
MKCQKRHKEHNAGFPNVREAKQIVVGGWGH